MQYLKTVLLRHARHPDPHYDWLFENPDDPAGALVALRCAHPWSHWEQLGRVLLTEMPQHRRRYLCYQGPLSDNRGRVTRVGAGEVQSLVWGTTRRRVLLHAQPGRAVLQVRARRLGPLNPLWEAVCVRAGASTPDNGAVHYP